ncbi:PAS domain S-box protein [Microvirga rosea]|uniref:PAS domain S-box protein n=1 Tax=Microvirga rosea TaxID=2715425 RepID=UPI001D0AC506|nr:PAS domain S-box protein [Microvirga rosea]MCB8819466.1 PAS domain S-box protein [Microvirga rosea]
MTYEQPRASTSNAANRAQASADELAYRLHQQEVLARFGSLALETRDFGILLQEATRLCAEGMRTRFSKVMEYLPDEDRFIIRAGVGWKPDVIGSRTGADPESPAGYAFRRHEPVIATHLTQEDHFRTPQALVQHGIKRSINVPIASRGGRFGVIEVDSPGESRFSEADIAFMQGFANLLGVALERSRGETALRDTEERYRLAARATNDTIWDWDLATDRIRWSEALATLFGYPETETEGAWWREHIHPDDRMRVTATLESVVAADGEHWSAEYRFLRADGSEAFVYDRGFVIRDGQGRAVRMIGSMLDLTERKRAEEALRRSEERLQGAFAIRTVGVMFRDEDFILSEANDAFLRMTGFKREEALGKTWRELTPEEFYAPSLQALQEVALHGESTPYEKQYFRKDGSRWWGLFAARRIGRETVEFVLDITDRKEAEERLRLSEARLSAIFAQATVGLSEVDSNGRFVEVNDELCRILGRSREELLGCRISDVTHVDDAIPSLSAVAQTLETGEPATLDKRYLRPDGTAVWANSSVTRLSRLADQSSNLLVVTIDLTARREVETALRESEERFQAIANSIDQMVWSTRPDGYHDFYNQRWYDFTGVPEGATDGAAWAEMFHPDDRERTWATWRHCLATGEPYRIEYRLRHRSGQYRWVLGRAQPVRDDQGRITRWFGTCTDIQEIVEAREVLARSREELEREIAERTEERDRIWQNSNELMGVFGFDGIRRSVNPAWSRVLGYDEDALLSAHMMDITHPADRPRLVQAIEKLAKGERLVDFEDRLRHADGSYRIISWTGVPGDGVFYGIGRDVTEYRHAEEALRQAQKMEAVGQLTGGVAHDFNNLLTIIRSSIDFLRRPNLPEERRNRYIDAISDTVDRASKLTGQLLAFARRQALKPVVFDVPERIRAVTDMLRTIVGSRIRIVADIACERCFVETDVTQFETALVNMAVNARDAMNGEGTLRIHVDALSRMPPVRGHAGSPGKFVAISISDTGSGIPVEKLNQIFEPFFTTKDVGKGTGLGLSQVYGFAKQSGGDVAVESVIGAGTTFTLYLPRTERDVAPEISPHGPGTEPTEEGRGCRVLVVEDNLDVGRFSTQLLQDLGYATTWATNAAEALNLLEEDAGRFDVVFSDVVMPGTSGVELGQKIRQRYPHIPVILTSGYSHVLAEEGRHGFELLHKPYTIDEVSRVMRRVMRRHVT